MKSRRIAVLLGTALALSACGERRVQAPPAARRGKPGVRITMEGLHRAGGVPVGWTLTLPPGDAAAGRAAFQELGCDACHAVNGEPFRGGPGPDLSGMGSHHPAAYFVESILNPDAVLIVGPSYIGPDGRSTMPSYPDLTAAELADLVAYLQSLVDPADPHALHRGAAAGAPDVPAPPTGAARAYFVWSYDVLPGKLAEFEEWFRTTGGPEHLAYDGVVSVDTYVDRRRPEGTLTTLIGFRDDEALARFLDDPATEDLGLRFDSFIGAHPHGVFHAPPVYRVPSLSAP